MRNAEAFLVAIVFLVIALAFASNYSSPSITGFASMPTYDNVSSIILGFANDKSFEYLGDKALFCIIVEMDNQTTYYYEFVKYNEEPYIKESYCASPSENRVIVKFNSYDDLMEFKNSPKQFITEKRNSGYYIFPSNYVKTGGDVKCIPPFQQRYCGALYNYFKSSELSAMGLSCCASYPFTPTGMAFILGDFIKSSAIFLIILIVIILFLIIISRKKKIKVV